jgi:hypothetical protein
MINLVCITDIGEGAEWSRHGQHWREYTKHTETNEGLPIHALAPWMMRFFDPSADRLENEEPLDTVPITNQDIMSFRENGFVVTSKPICEQQRNNLDKVFASHLSFSQYILFDRDNLKRKNGQNITLTNDLLQQILTKPESTANFLTGNPKAFYLFDCKQCSRFPKAPKSGLGPSTSCYGIPEFLQFQAHCALLLEKVYGEQCMVIPERVRVKANSKWGFLHSDRRLLPEESISIEV